MNVVAFEPGRLWPDWRIPDSVDRAHFSREMARATGGDVRDWIGREMLVWKPGFLPRHACVRFAAEVPEAGRRRSLLPRRGVHALAYVPPSWPDLIRYRGDLRPRIMGQSAVAWLGFALSLCMSDGAAPRLVSGPEDLILPDRVPESRRAHFARRVARPEILTEGGDGAVIRAVVQARAEIAEATFHVRRDGEIALGAVREIDGGTAHVGAISFSKHCA